MAILHENNYQSTINSAIDAVTTTIVVSSDAGFPPISPTDVCTLTIDDGISREIVLVTSKSGTTLTVIRGYEGTTAQAWDAGDPIENRLTADTIDDKLSKSDEVDDDETFSVTSSSTVPTTRATKIYVDNNIRQEASQAEVEATTITDKYMSPANTNYHPGVAKAWGVFSVDGVGTLTTLAEYGILSITRIGVGIYEVIMDTSMSSANYVVLAMHESQGTNNIGATGYVPGFTVTANTFRLESAKDNGDAIDSNRVTFVVFGDQ